MSLPERMRADLTRAMKARDKVTVNVLRTTLAAIANAEAPPQGEAPTQVIGSPELAGPNEVERLVLSDDDIARIVRAEIADREHTIEQVAGAGGDEQVTDLQAELEILRAYV
jgi:uncharacterized protein YqeY